MDELYKDEVLLKGQSALCGDLDGQTDSLRKLKAAAPPVLRAWANDDDLQEITIVSTCIGFVRTYTKQYAKGE